MLKVIKDKILENKISVILIIMLTVVIITLQTKISMKDSKIENLNVQIKNIQEELNLNKSESKNQEDTTENIKGYIYDGNSNYFKEIKGRFIRIGEIENKIYDENLDGKVVNTFSWIDEFTISDKQIENLLKGLKKEKFKINFYINNTSNFNSYKIEVIE